MIRGGRPRVNVRTAGANYGFLVLPSARRRIVVTPDVAYERHRNLVLRFGWNLAFSGLTAALRGHRTLDLLEVCVALKFENRQQQLGRRAEYKRDEPAEPVVLEIERAI